LDGGGTISVALTLVGHRFVTCDAWNGFLVDRNFIYRVGGGGSLGSWNGLLLASLFILTKLLSLPLPQQLTNGIYPKCRG
jgi:hypothetical protein